MPVHRTQQRVDIDEGALVDAGQHRGSLGQRDQQPTQHRPQLTDMAVGELPQEDPQRGARVDPAEELLHATRADHVQVIDTVRPGRHPSDDRGQLRCRVGRPRLDPLTGEPHMLAE